MQQRILNLIEERKDELFSLLSDLVKINSESFGSYGNEEEIAKYIDVLCKDLGLESDLYSPLSLDGFKDHPDYLPGRSLENRYNVVAKWQGEEDENELMLMAHTDTVMIGDPQNWDVTRFPEKSKTANSTDAVLVTISTPLPPLCLL